MTKEVTITALDIYNAAFDKACESYYEKLSLQELCKYVEEYADNVFDVILEYVTVTTIILAHVFSERARYNESVHLENILKKVNYISSTERAIFMKEYEYRKI